MVTESLKKADDQVLTDEGYGSDRIDELVLQIEHASDDEERDLDSVKHADGVSPAALWPFLRSATYMASMHQFVHEKHRVQSILAKELVRAERELQSDPSIASARIEGDICLYSLEQQRKRRANKKNPGFLSGVSRLWSATKANMDRERVGTEGNAEKKAGELPGMAVGIDKASFIGLMVKIQYLVICPPVDPELAMRIASHDWEKDNGEDSMTMAYECFVDSMFELVDMWTDTSDENEYAELSNIIAEGITIEYETHERPTLEAAGDANKEEIGDEQGSGTTEMKQGEGLQLPERFRLKHADEIVYDPRITKDPMKMDDLQIGEDDTVYGENAVDTPLDQWGGDKDGTLIDGGEKLYVNRETVTGSGQVLAGSKGEQDHTGTKSNGKGLLALKRRHRRGRDKASKVSSIDEGDESNEARGAKSTLLSLSRGNNAAHLSSVNAFSAERINAAIAKMYLSKMQVDGKLLQRDGNLSWAERTRRKKHERMDRFVLQYHIRQFGTKKLARHNLHVLCQSVTRLASQYPRIELFADLIGIPVMVESSPYAERIREYRPFICSNFILPVLVRICPRGEKLDRWMGNGRAPVTISSSEFLQALREVCPHVPPGCPAMVGFTLQLGRLAGDLDTYYRQNQVAVGKRPNGWRSYFDLDAGLLAAMPLWTCEEEYLIMQLTLRSINVLETWLYRSCKRKRLDKQASAGGQAQEKAEGQEQEPSHMLMPEEAALPSTGDATISLLKARSECPFADENNPKVRVPSGRNLESVGEVPGSIERTKPPIETGPDENIIGRPSSRSAGRPSAGRPKGKRASKSKKKKSKASSGKASSTDMQAAAQAAATGSGASWLDSGVAEGTEEILDNGRAELSVEESPRRRTSRRRRSSSLKRNRAENRKEGYSQSLGKEIKRQLSASSINNASKTNSNDETGITKALVQSVSAGILDDSIGTLPETAVCRESEGASAMTGELPSPLPKQRLLEARELDQSFSPANLGG